MKKRKSSNGFDNTFIDWDKITSYYQTYRVRVNLPFVYARESSITAERNRLDDILSKKREKLSYEEAIICSMLLEAFNDGIQHRR